MKSYFLILFIVAANLIAREHVFITHADTLENKGVNANDTLSLMLSDSLMLHDSLSLQPKEKVSLFINSITSYSNDNYFNQVKHKNFSTEDYRNLSDVLIYLPFASLQDLGSFGQPNEQMFYGLGFSNISYNRDGVLLNNRWTNSYDLYNLNSERIDSLEVSPITTGFLYSTYNNPVSVNIHSRFQFSKRPITRLKFFQASYDEGFIDVLFHTPVTEKLSFGFGVSNSAIDSRFTNSDYESWKLDASISYLVNKNLNITANYYYTQDTLALFGGLDTNIILNENVSKVLYGNTSTGESLRYQLTYNNNAAVKILSTYIPNSKTDLTIYYNSSSQKYKQNIDSLASELPVINNDNYYNTFGVRLQNYFSQHNLVFDLTANYEITNIENAYYADNQTQEIASLSGKLSYSFTSFFTPSVYGKLNNFNDSLLVGYGFDLSGLIGKGISYYAGISWFDKQTTILEQYMQPNFIPRCKIVPRIPISQNNSTEIGVKFKTEYLSGQLSYFTYKTENSAVPYTSGSANDSLLINELYLYTKKDISNSGFNFSFNLKFWKLLFSNSFNYYFSSQYERTYSSPDYTLAGKLYYTNLLFENNFDIKVGFNYRLTGEQAPFVYDFEKLQQIGTGLTTQVSYSEIPSSFQLNLYLSGTIQKRATLFITLENILNTEYYIAPYYFKEAINMRFGVSWLLFD